MVDGCPGMNGSRSSAPELSAIASESIEKCGMNGSERADGNCWCFSSGWINEWINQTNRRQWTGMESMGIDGGSTSCWVNFSWQSRCPWRASLEGSPLEGSPLEGSPLEESPLGGWSSFSRSGLIDAGSSASLRLDPAFIQVNPAIRMWSGR